MPCQINFFKTNYWDENLAPNFPQCIEREEYTNIPKQQWWWWWWWWYGGSDYDYYDDDEDDDNCDDAASTVLGKVTQSHLKTFNIYVPFYVKITAVSV